MVRYPLRAQLWQKPSEFAEKNRCKLARRPFVFVFSEIALIRRKKIPFLSEDFFFEIAIIL